MSSFDSIFKQNDKIDPNLNNMFSKKTENVSENNKASIIETEKKTKEESIQVSNKFKPTKKQKHDPECENRTIFVGNLKSDSKKEELVKLFKKYGKIETVRFRNIVPEDLTKSKKYGFITKQTHPNKKTINAFVRFDNLESAKTAAKEMNGSEYNSLHLRVDLATRSKIHDNKRSIFLGGLPFDISDEDIYNHFSACGLIEFVRIIRDNKTGIGKGFGYVQFKEAASVSLGLKMNGSTIAERKIRVTRCVKKEKVKNIKDKNQQKTKSDFKKKANKKEVPIKKGSTKNQENKNTAKNKKFKKTKNVSTTNTKQKHIFKI